MLPIQKSKDIAGWFLLAIIVYAPWAFGCTRPWTIVVLDMLMGAVALTWVVERFRERRRPRWPKIMLLAIAWLVFQGWCMAANGHFLYDRGTAMFTKNSAGIAFLPGAVDTLIVSHVMWRYTGLLAILLVVADLAKNVDWRQRIMKTVGITGLSIVLLAYAQKFSGAQNIFWEPGNPTKYFFGTYFYHGNAGAYLNLVLPVLLGQIIIAAQKPFPGWKIAFWSVSALLVFLAAFANISKAGMAISILLLIASAVGFKRMRGEKMIGFDSRWRTVSQVAALLIVVLAATAASQSHALSRWTEFFRQLDMDYPRIRLAETCMRMVVDAGPYGFGPGTFQFTFPHYETTSQFPGIWSFAHQDYLQTLIEWGWVGGFTWGILLSGGLCIGLRLLGRPVTTQMNDQTILFCSSLSLIGIALHSFADFPLQIASLQLYSVVFLGLCWSSPAWNRSRDKTSRPRAPAVKH